MKPIKITEEYNNSIIEALKAQLLNTKTNSGKININIDLKTLINPSEAKQINITFSAIAFIKYSTLVQHNTDEVGWHGTVERLSDTDFLITDIFVYPQTVSGATVTPDQIKYQMWLYEEFDDETFPKVRFHGHSHVNMATSPSSVDLTFRQEILDQLTNEDFYIFSIHNKRGDREINLYDMRTNWIYETSDITINVLLNDQTTKDFLKETDANITKYAAPRVYSGNIYGFTESDPYDMMVNKKFNTDDSTHLMSKKEEKELQKYLNKQNKTRYDPDKDVKEFIKKHGNLNT